MQSSIDRYFRESNYEYSISNSRFFKQSRDVLEGKARLLCGKVNKGRRMHTVGMSSAR